MQPTSSHTRLTSVVVSADKKGVTRRTTSVRPATAARRGAVAIALAVAVALLTRLPLTSAAFTATTANGSNAFGAAASWCPTPGSVTLTTLNDAEVDEKQPTTNYGNKAPIEVRSNAGDDRRIYLRPPLPAVPAGCTLQSVVLTLTVVAYEPDRTYHAYRATSQWDVNTITWANQPGITGSPAAAVTAPGTFTMDVTGPVRGLYANPPGANYGIRIQDSAEDASRDLNSKFDSLDGSSPGRFTYTWG